MNEVLITIKSGLGYFVPAIYTVMDGCTIHSMDGGQTWKVGYAPESGNGKLYMPIELFEVRPVLSTEAVDEARRQVRDSLRAVYTDRARAYGDARRKLIEAETKLDAFLAQNGDL